MTPAAGVSHELAPVAGPRPDQLPLGRVALNTTSRKEHRMNTNVVNRIASDSSRLVASRAHARRVTRSTYPSRGSWLGPGSRRRGRQDVVGRWPAIAPADHAT